MAFRRTRLGATNRYSHDRGSWMSRDASHYEQADRDYKPSVAVLPEKIAHPVVKAPEYKCYRVIRMFYLDGHSGIEDIGYGSQRDAMAILATEKWRAQVIDPNGRPVSDNWLDMEKR